jgi:hypothetical protein
MLGIALGAMVLSCILLVLLWKRYDFKIKATALPATSAAVALVSNDASENPYSVRL